MIRTFHRICLAILLCAVASVQVVAGEVQIIANSSVGASSASKDEIKGVFLQTKTSLSDGSRVQPVLSKAAAASSFSEEYLGKTAAGLETYYRSLVFSGTGTLPKTLNSDDDVIAYVSKTKGAIGFVSAGSKPAGVKVLTVTESGVAAVSRACGRGERFQVLAGGSGADSSS